MVTYSKFFKFLSISPVQLYQVFATFCFGFEVQGSSDLGLHGAVQQHEKGWASCTNLLTYGTRQNLRARPYFFTLNPKFQPRPVINKPSPLQRDYNGDPNMKALKRRGFLNHGSTSISLTPGNLRHGPRHV